jgi:ABC-type transporter Mla maintaining outer membrane lipid asymmetry ATPase subunit MlaF
MSAGESLPRPAGAPNVIAARGVDVEIGGTRILHGADLAVRQGDLVAIV